MPGSGIGREPCSGRSQVNFSLLRNVTRRLRRGQADLAMRVQGEAKPTTTQVGLMRHPLILVPSYSIQRNAPYSGLSRPHGRVSPNTPATCRNESLACIMSAFAL